MADDLIGLGVLQQRVLHTEEKLGEIKSELRDLTSSIKELNSTIVNMGKPKWALWISATTLFCGITWTVWIYSIDNTINPITDRVRGLEITASTVVPREMHIEKWDEAKANIARLQDEINQKASKDDLNHVIIEIDKRLGRK